MPKKKIRTYFFTSDIRATDPDAEQEPTISEILGAHVEKGRTPPKLLTSGHGFEIRDLTKSKGGRPVISGVLAKLRDEDLPHVGVPGGGERELDMERNEKLLEKNYFRYQPDRDLLVYQQNWYGATIGQFAAYVSTLSGHTIAFDPVLQPEPTKRLLQGSVEAKTLELSFAKPRNPDMFPQDQWNQDLLRALSHAGGEKMFVRMTPGTGAPVDQRRLNKRIKRAMNAMVNSGHASVAKMNIIEDGVEHPIDLIADRLYSEQTVEMEGRYPVPTSVHAALRQAVQDNKQELQEILG